MRILVPLSLIVIVLAGCGGSSSSGNNSNSNSNSSSSSGSTNPFALGGLNHVHTIAVEPSNPSTLYLGSHYHLYKSTDGGKTWHPLLKQMMYSLALDPAHPTTMYGLTLQSGLLKSTDGGVHWKSTANGVKKGRVIGVAYDPSTRAVLAYGSGIFRSTDGGAHWTHVVKLVNTPSLAVGSKGTVYAASLVGLRISRDGGVHYQTPSTVGNQPIIQVIATGTTAYAATPVGLYRTADLGHTWHVLAKAPQGIEYLGTSPANPNDVIAETAAKGFTASDNGGKTWSAANAGITHHNFASSVVRFAPSSSKVVYTGAWGLYFYASHDGGRHWTLTSTLKH